MSFRAENVRYLRPLWIRAGIAWVLLALVLVSFGVTATGMTDTWPLLVGAGVGAAIGVSRRLSVRARGRRVLQQPSADVAARTLFGAVANLGRNIGEPIAISGTANLHVIYGNRDRANDLLGRVDWDKLPPFIRGDRKFVDAAMAYIDGDYARGYAIAREVPPLMDIPALAPGSRRIKRAVAMLTDMGRMLAEDDREAAARLAVYRGKSNLQRGLAFWALSVAYERWEDTSAAAHWRAESRKLLPHAYGLGVPRPTSAVLQPAVSSNPYAAPSQAAANDIPFEGRADAKARRGRVLLFVVIALVLLFVWAMLSLHLG